MEAYKKLNFASPSTSPIARIATMIFGVVEIVEYRSALFTLRRTDGSTDVNTTGVTTGISTGVKPDSIFIKLGDTMDYQRQKVSQHA